MSHASITRKLIYSSKHLANSNVRALMVDFCTPKHLITQKSPQHLITQKSIQKTPHAPVILSSLLIVKFHSGDCKAGLFTYADCIMSHNSSFEMHLS